MPESIKDVNSCGDLIQCAFSLNGFEVEVYEPTIWRTGWARTAPPSTERSRGC